MIDNGQIKNYLTPVMAQRGFEFFHTWWYANREVVKIGEDKRRLTVKEYLDDPEKASAECGFKIKAQQVLKDLKGGKDIFKQNYFLIGKGYPRESILENERLATSLHEEILLDLNALYPLLKGIYDLSSK